jgi:TonB family protein
MTTFRKLTPKAALLLAAIASTSALSRTVHAQGTPAAASKLTKPPKLVTFVEAEYPPSERAAGKAATVTLRITIGADGRPSEVVVEKSAGAAFDAAAVAAARGFVFEPAEIDGKPAPIKILYDYGFVLREEAPTTGALAGVIRDRASKAPLADVTVTLDPGGAAKSVTTGPDGRFSFDDLAPGAHVVSLAGPRLTGLQTEETIEVGKRLDVVYDVTQQAEATSPDDQDDLEIVIVAPPLQKAAVSTESAAEQGRKVPGTQGDVVKVVESMPGVGRASAGSGALVVWGAAPQDTRVYVDGVRIPVLYHLGGVRSVFAGDLVKSVELVPGGYGATYGRGLGGIVLVQSKRLEGDGIHGSATVDVLDAAATVRGKVADRLRAAVAARRSHLHSVVEAATDRDVGELFPIPRYWDGQLRVAYEFSDREEVELAALSSSDRVDRTVSSVDPGRRRRDTRAIDFSRVWLRYRKALGEGTEVTFVPWIGVDRSRRLDAFGAIETELATDATIYGARAAWRAAVDKALSVSVGLDAEVSSARLSRRGSIALPTREGDVRVFGQPPPDQINADAWTATSATLAPWIEGDLTLFEKLHVIPGLRLDPYVTSVSRRTPVVGDTPEVGAYTKDFAAEPRLALKYAPDPRVRLHAAYGRYRQPPPLEDLSGVFGSPLLPPSRATHYVLGAAFQWTRDLAVEVTAFHARTEDLPMRSRLPSPILAEALVPTGEGRVLGTQFLVRMAPRDGGRLFGWISWTVLRSERRDREDLPWRPFDFDQSHVLTAVASYDLGRGFEVGTRFRYATGLPRTSVVSAYYDARRDLYQPVFGQVNGTRLPDFAQLDLRVAWRTKFGGDTTNPREFEAYLDVQNVTDRENAEEFVFDATFTRRDVIRGVPFLPVAGLRVTW